MNSIFHNIWFWLGVYVVGVIVSYIITKLIDKYDEKINGYHTKDASEEYATTLMVVLSWLGILCVIIIGVAAAIKGLIDKYLFKEDE